MYLLSEAVVHEGFCSSSDFSSLQPLGSSSEGKIIVSAGKSKYIVGAFLPPLFSASLVKHCIYTCNQRASGSLSDAYQLSLNFTVVINLDKNLSQSTSLRVLKLIQKIFFLKFFIPGHIRAEVERTVYLRLRARN